MSSKRKWLTPEKMSKIAQAVQAMTVKEVADKMHLPISTIYHACNKIGVPVRQSGKRVEKKKPVFTRPPAVYSNSPSPYGIADKFHNKKYAS